MSAKTYPAATVVARRRRRLEITASTTFTVPATCVQVRVFAVGGGSSGQAFNAEAGGGHGGGIIDTFADVSAGQVLTIAIGSGGAGVTAADGSNVRLLGNAGTATTLTSSTPTTISITAPGATTSGPGNTLGGVGASVSTNSGGTGLGAQSSSRSGYADGGGGGGTQYGAPSAAPSGVSGGAGAGVTTSQPPQGTFLVAGPGRANTGGGGGGCGGYSGSTSTVPSFTSGAGGSGIVILEWEE